MDYTPFNLFCSIPLSCAELGKALQAHVAGKVTAIGDPAYEDLRRALVWNEPAPGRRPTLICRAATEHDVMAAVDFARAHRLKVAVRGGGHNWVGFSLRDHSLLIDLGELKRVISIDAKAHTATVQPAVGGRELNPALAKSGFAFPVGHRPTVPLSGFLLNGGLGCNFGGGPGCLSIEAANVVTADGRLVVASDTRHPDLLWAIRGAGPGFFGLITQYRLKTRPTPRAITACDYFYPMERCEHCRQDAEGSRADAVLYRRAPPLAVQAKSSNGYVALLKATAFADTKAEAAAALAPLEGGPASLGLLSKELNQPMTMSGLLDLGGELWPQHHRYCADTLWTNAAPEQPLAIKPRDGTGRSPPVSALSSAYFGLDVKREPK